MDTDQPAGRRRPIAIIAAAGLVCLAIAVPVSGAFGAGSSGNDGNSSGIAPLEAQDGQGGPYGQGRHGPGHPDRGRDGAPQGGSRHPCPKDEGSGSGSGSSGSDSSGTAPSGDTVAL